MSNFNKIVMRCDECGDMVDAEDVKNMTVYQQGQPCGVNLCSGRYQRCVRVRIAVATNKEGWWYANGDADYAVCGSGVTTITELRELRPQEEHGGERLSWITGYVPLPEQGTIEGETES